MAPDRLPPQTIADEKALLGSIMMSSEVLDAVVPIIGTADAFYTPAHRILYTALVAVHDRGDPMDLNAVCDELRRAKAIEEVGGDSYLVELSESFADWSNAEFYARVVAREYRKLLFGIGERSEG